MRILVLSLILLAMCALTACHTVRPVPTDNWQTTRNMVHPGDVVDVTTRDGNTHHLTVVQVSDDAVVGKHTSVPREQIRSIEMRSVNKGKTVTTSVIGGVLLFILSIAALGG